MVSPSGPDPLTALAGELAQIGRRLDGMAAELSSLRGAAPAPQPPPFPHYQPQLAPPYPPTPFVPPPYRPVPPPAPARAASIPTVGGARLLAWTGASVTLLGVALLMALAASRGWFDPPVRIGVGAVLGAVLVGLGMWLHRRESARVGAVAVAATGFATLYLVLAGATAAYHYLVPAAGLALALAVAAAGLGLAERWRSRWLADGVAAGALVLAPVITWTWLLVALALAMSVAALPVVVRRQWPDLALVVGGLTALYATVVCAVDALDPGDTRTRAVALAAATVVVGLATTVAAARRVTSRQLAALPPMAAVPALVTACVIDGWTGAAVAAGAALATALPAACPWIDRALRLTTSASAVVALFVATAVALDGSTFTIVLLGEALTAAVLAWAFRSRFAAVAAVAIACPGLALATFRDAPVDALAQARLMLGASAHDLVVAAAVSALVLALAGALLAAAGRLGWARPDAGTVWIWAPLGVVGLYGVTGLVVNLALLVSERDGFTAGHAIVTVSWTLGALALLARGIRRPALRVAGLVLVGAAVAKLVLFDLVALDGIVRVAAFIAAGLVLLAAGTRYARMVAENEPEKEPTTAPTA